MSGFNTKTPTMDFSPWLKRDFSTQNKAGALAEAFQIAADLRDAYGETADKNLLSQVTNETDISKIPQDFYDKQNALKAKSIIETNKSLAFQDEQRKRADELNARSDAEYYVNQFNKEAIGDVWKYDNKADFDAKYGNAGGLDYTQIQNAWNMKEDRNLSLEDRQRQIELHNLNVQKTKNSMARANEEYNYNKQKREQNDNDNKFLNDYYTGNLNDELITQYKDKVSPKVFGEVINEKKSSDILNKYKSWEDFRNSEDYANPEYNYTVKKTVYDSFGKGGKNISVNEQIKLEEIDYNKKDLPRIKEEYKNTYGVEMPISEQSKFVYKGEIPEKLKAEKEKKPLSTKEAKELDGLIKYKETLNELKLNHHSDSVGGLDNTTSNLLPDALKGDKARRFEALMNDVLLGKTSALAGTLSDKDMALLKASGLAPNLGDKDFIKVRDNLINKVDNLIKERYELLNESYKMPEYYNTIVQTEISKENNNNKPVITSIRKKDTTNTNTKTIIGTGMTSDGRKVVKYSDGSIEYAN